MKKKIIGRSDIVRFPDLDLDAISVKIDSGAYTSTMHCHEIKVDKKEGIETLSFKLLDPEHEHYHGREFTFSQFENKMIKNSFGEVENRYVIMTKIELFNKEYPIELTLTNRGNMKFPVLLGRKILDNFLVDVSKVNCSYNKNLVTK